jgi:hypothetical protein
MMRCMRTPTDTALALKCHQQHRMFLCSHNGHTCWYPIPCSLVPVMSQVALCLTSCILNLMGPQDMCSFSTSTAGKGGTGPGAWARVLSEGGEGYHLPSTLQGDERSQHGTVRSASCLQVDLVLAR